MLYQGYFEDSNSALVDILLHASSFNIELISATVNQGNLVIETLGTIPEDQLDHLGISLVA